MHRIEQSLGGAVMKVRCARGKTTQDRSLDLADVIKFSIDGRLAKIGGRLAVARRRTCGRIYIAGRDARQIAHIKAAHIGGNVGRTWIAGADVQRRRERVIAHIWSIVTSAAGSWKCREIPPGTRPPVATSSLMPATPVMLIGLELKITSPRAIAALRSMPWKFRPRAKRIENRRGENVVASSHKSSWQLQRSDQRVDAGVDTDKKWLRNKRQRPAIPAVSV